MFFTIHCECSLLHANSETACRLDACRLLCSHQRGVRVQLPCFFGPGTGHLGMGLKGTSARNLGSIIPWPAAGPLLISNKKIVDRQRRTHCLHVFFTFQLQKVDSHAKEHVSGLACMQWTVPCHLLSINAPPAGFFKHTMYSLSYGRQAPPGKPHHHLSPEPAPN